MACWKSFTNQDNGQNAISKFYIMNFLISSQKKTGLCWNILLTNKKSEDETTKNKTIFLKGQLTVLALPRLLFFNTISNNSKCSSMLQDPFVHGPSNSIWSFSCSVSQAVNWRVDETLELFIKMPFKLNKKNFTLAFINSTLSTWLVSVKTFHHISF